MTALCILHNDEITKILQNCPTFHENILDQSSVDFMSCSITAKQWANVKHAKRRQHNRIPQQPFTNHPR